jgi:hypothetical protein
VLQEGSQRSRQKASKYLYQGLHKLAQLRCILRGLPLLVWLPSGSDDHSRIMRIRTGHTGAYTLSIYIS